MEESSFNASATGGSANGAGFELKPQVFNVRGRRVVLDREVAAYIGMPTGRLNEVFRRNKQIFSDEMIFQLTNDEFCGLKTQIAFSNIATRGGSRHLPMVYSAEGVSMLEKVLKRSIPIEFEDEPPLPAIYEESWNEGTVVLYQPNKDLKIDVRVENETVWLTQEQMALLFSTTQPNIAMHIRNIFDDGELEIGATYKDFLYVQTEGGKQKNRYIKIYNLDMIISVGYRVNTRNGIAFRQWATKVLKGMLLHRHYYDSRLDAYDRKFFDTDKRLDNLEDRVDFIIKANITPKAGILKGNTVYDAHIFVSDLIEKANKSITLIDPYIDSSVLVLIPDHHCHTRGTAARQVPAN